MIVAVTNKNVRSSGVWLLLAALIIAAAFGVATPQKAYGAYNATLFKYKVKVEKNYLALRKAQAFEKKNEIGELYTGETVIACPVDFEKDGYRYVYSPKLKKLGFVNGDYLVYDGIYNGGSHMYARVESGYLALRNAKATDPKNEIGKLYTGDAVTVLDDTDSGFWTVYAPGLSMAGYVNKNYLVSSTSYSDKYVEPEMPVSIATNAWCEWNYESESSDYLNFHVKIENFSRTKTVTAVELVYYVEDVWGNRPYGDNTVYRMTTEKTISPGQIVYTDFAPLPQRNKIYSVHTAVTKCRLSDGTICQYRSIPESAYGIFVIK